MTEYGIFNDEGLIEDGFFSYEEASFVADGYDKDENAHVLEICPDHPEHANSSCEECNAEDD